jgi:2-hydroxychromene-2-carboxylate isomerase
MQIDYYLTTISPFVYLAGTRLEEVAARHGAAVAYRPVPIMDLFARTGGTPPAERHPARQDYRMQELRRQAARLGMPINLRPAHFPTNPAPSCYAVIAAARDGSGDVGALVAGLARACWAEERDVAEDDVIADCLEAAGFDRGLTMRGMMEGAETYARNLEAAVAAGVFGTPFYVVGDERFWGQDRIEALDAHLAAA